MSYDALSERSVVLRLEFSISDAVQQRGLLPVLAAAIRAWWVRPRAPQQVPAYLRADIGLPPANEPMRWHTDPVAGLILHRKNGEQT